MRKVIALIGRDESRHIAAGARFYGEVYDQFRKNRHEIMAKNLATTLVLAIASYELVNPMRTLQIDLGEVMDAMYAHYQDVTSGMPAFPEQGVRDAMLAILRRRTPHTIRAIAALTGADGRVDVRRLVNACGQAIKPPRALRDLLAA